MKITVLGAAGRMGQLHARHLIEMGHEVIEHDPPAGKEGRGLSECDAVVIASPADKHLRHLWDAVAYDKHVFVEKPICLIGQVAETRMALQQAMEKSLVVATGYNLRFHPLVIKAKWAIESGKFLVMWGGFLLRQTPKRPLSAFLEEWASHEIDLAMHLLGPVKDFKLIRHENGKHPSVDLMIHHQSGAVSVIHADAHVGPPVRKFTLVDETGHTFTADIETHHVQDDHYKAELREWIKLCQPDGVALGKPLLATGHDGLAVIDLLERLK